MDNIKEQLISLYDEMFEKLDKFNKGSYNNIFLSAFRKYEDLLDHISDLLEDTPKEERKTVVEELARILPYKR